MPQSQNSQENQYARQAREDAKAFSEGLRQLGGENKKLLAGIAALFLGGFGIHKFILGYIQEGLILLIPTLLGTFFITVGIGLTWVWIPATIGFIEGIVYLMKTDREFYEVYQKGRRPWF